MADPKVQQFIAPALFSDIRVGNKISRSAMNQVGLAASSCQQIRTGYGCTITQFYNSTALGSQYQDVLLPYTGVTSYAWYANQYAVRALTNGTYTSISSTGFGYAYYGNIYVNGFVIQSYIGPALLWLRLGSGSGNVCVFNDKRNQIADAGGYDLEAVGNFGQPNQIYYNPYFVDNVSNFAPALLESLEKSAKSSAFTPQIFFQIPCPYVNTNWRIIDPYLEFRQLVDRSSATVYLDRQALMDGELYIYVALQRGAAVDNSYNAATLELYFDCVRIPLQEVYRYSNYSLAAARIPPPSSVENKDYVKREIKLSSNSWPALADLTTNTPWVNNTTYSVTSNKRFGVTAWIAGRVKNSLIDMTNVV